jgi:hypothetical protein
MPYKDPEKRRQSNRETKRKWLSNPENLKIHNERSRLFYQNNPEKRNEYRRKYRSSAKGRLIDNLRSRLKRCIKNQSGSKFIERNFGCSREELLQHIENKFVDGMTWENYGEWHIDHIKPLSKFDLSSLEEQYKANHYTNLQPLWKKDNLSKKDKYED